MARARALERLQALLSDIASWGAQGGGARAGTALGSTSMRPGAAGLHAAARSEPQGVRSRPLAALTGGGAASGGSPLLTATLQLWVGAEGPANVGRRRRQMRSHVVAAAAGWQRPPTGGARLHAAAAAEPAPVAELSISSSTGSSEDSTALVATAAVASDALVSWQRQLSLAGGAGLQAAAAAVADATISLEGTVQKITFRAADTGYTVMRVQLTSPKKAAQPGSPRAGSSSDGALGSDASGSQSGSDSGGEGAVESVAAPDVQLPAALGKARVITVVGSLPQVALGQALRLHGTWVEHKQYGLQLRATDMETLSPSSDDEMVAYLGGGAIPGVGPHYAQRMVRKWGTDIEAKLNSRSALRYLAQCEGIGKAKAEKIKAAWDATKGTREGVVFLKEHGIPLPLAQRVAERCAQQTVAWVRNDPYAAMTGSGLPFSKVDQLAAKVGAPADLVSRAAMAMQQCLSAAAAEEGHTFLPWHRLEKDCRRLLEETGRHHGTPWGHAGALHLVAQHMHACDMLVAEPAGTAAAAEEAAAVGGQQAEQAAAAELESADVVAAGSHAAGVAQPGPAAAPARVHPDFAGDLAALREYLASCLKGVPASNVDSVLAAHGEGALAVLDAQWEESIRGLCKCRKVGPKTAEKIKTAWERSQGNALAGAPFTSGAAAAGTSPGLTMPQLLEAPPAVGFAWGQNTRCYTPLLHAAEQVVAQCSLQRAAAYKPASTRQLNRVRRWLEASQARTFTAGAAAAAAGIQLNAGQARAIELASDAPLMVLTGGPGCGKTTVVQTIVKLWCAQRKMVRIAAPTGRAAQRMGEIQGIEPCTIHRLLGYQPRGSNGSRSGARGSAAGGVNFAEEDASVEEGTRGGFQYNRGNPLPADAVLIDEASMLSLPLAAALFDALRPKCQLVLVGDVDQLPPVGPGAVLQSLISSRLVPVVDLREIFRQAAESAIITSALAVRRGEVPMLKPVAPAAEALAAATSDALLVGAPGPEDLPAAVRDTVVSMRQAHGYYRGGPFGEEGDLQVLSPMRKGPAGTTALNPMLQALLNPPAPGKPEIPRHHAHTSAGGASTTTAAAAGKVFRVGDRVIQQVNNYDKDVFNGDQGRVVECHPAERRLAVHFPHLDGPEPGPDGWPAGLREYQGVELGQLELAYAITVHKAQGGEAQHVVLALSPAHGRMLTRRLLYTGLTRAKQQLVVVAAGSSVDPLAKAVRCKESEVRLTSLQSRLEEGRSAAGLPELPAQQFSNEEQMLQQAAQWQRQAAERVAAERAAAAGTAAAAEASHLAEDWGHPAAERQQWSAGGSWQAESWQQPSTPQLAAAAAALRAEGLPAELAGELVAALARHCPKAVLDWQRCAGSFAWLQRECGAGVTWELVVQRTPLLLAMHSDELARTRQFVGRFVGREALLASSLPSSSDSAAPSAVEQMLWLQAVAAETGGAASSQQQQQQAPAG
ncbi:hypothetical protein ABPG75_013394 [Micractinium tetrahymenae]